jgi:hypothetical protein
VVAHRGRPLRLWLDRHCPATEAGHPELAFDGLVGFFGPPGMPLDLRERIAADVRVVTDAIIESRLITTGQIVNLGGPVEFANALVYRL